MNVGAITRHLNSSGERQIAGLFSRRLIRRTELRTNRRRRAIVGEWGKNNSRQRSRGIQAVHLPCSLVGSKEEQLVSLDGSADRSAELVLLQGRARLSGRIPEERIGVENIVAQEFPRISMKLVLAGSGNQLDTRHSRALPRIV